MDQRHIDLLTEVVNDPPVNHCADDGDEKGGGRRAVDCEKCDGEGYVED